MRFNLIDSSLYKKNRKKLTGILKDNSVAIIHSNDEMHRSGDQNYKFRQNSNLLYLTGIVQEMTILLLVPGHSDEKMREILFIRRSNPKLEIWEGHKLTSAEAEQISGIRKVKWYDEFASTLKELLVKTDTVYYDIPESPKYVPENPYRSQRLLLKLKTDYPLHRYERLFPEVARLRMVKEQEEIEIIKKACSITREGFTRVLHFLKPGVAEYEIEAEITHSFICNGAEGHAYLPIIASGINACTLHYITNNSICKDGHLVLMDFGAEYACYSSDLTRTLPVNGRYTPRQREIYEATLRIFRFARSLMKPGTTINKIHDETCRKWEEEHIRLGLYTAEEVKSNKTEEKLWSRFYPHGTAHFMGLDVHDTGSKDDEFQPGMVLTCEPAIYIPAENIGIRIENNILITGDGNIDLMEDFPIEPDHIEQEMNKKP